MDATPRFILTVLLNGKKEELWFLANTVEAAQAEVRWWYPQAKILATRLDMNDPAFEK